MWLVKSKTFRKCTLGENSKNVLKLKKKMCESPVNKNTKRHPFLKQIRLVGLIFFSPSRCFFPESLSSVNSSENIPAVLG